MVWYDVTIFWKILYYLIDKCLTVTGHWCCFVPNVQLYGSVVGQAYPVA